MFFWKNVWGEGSQWLVQCFVFTILLVSEEDEGDMTG
jgi:hypothetical protein